MTYSTKTQSNRRGTEFNLCNGYHSHCSPTMRGKLLCAKITYLSMVFPHKINSDNPITTFSVTTLQRIAAATGVKVLPTPISSATSAPGVSVDQTHLLTMNQMAQNWCARNVVSGRPRIEHLWPGPWPSIDWWTGCEFSSLTASSSQWFSNSVLRVLSAVLSTELVLSGSRTSWPSTCSWTSLSPWLVFFSSWIISFGCSEVSWAEWLKLWCFWNSSRC